MDYLKLPCPPWGDVECEFQVSTEIQHVGTEAVGAELLRAWPKKWCLIHETVTKIATEYERLEELDTSTKQIYIEIDEYNDGLSAWTVNIHTDPFASVFDVEFEEDSIIDSGVAF